MWLGQNAGLEVCALPPLWLSLRGRKRKLPQEAGAGTASFLPHFVGQSSQQACPDSKRLRVSWRGQGNVMMQKNTRGVPVAIFGKHSPLHSTISQIQSAYHDLSGPTGSDSCHPSLLVPFPLISGTASPSMAPLLWCEQTSVIPPRGLVPVVPSAWHALPGVHGSPLTSFRSLPKCYHFRETFLDNPWLRKPFQPLLVGCV